jgi:hypothetical protein
VSRFVVDDGGAFLSEDEDWEPPDSSLDAPGGWGRGTRSRPVAKRYPSRTRARAAPVRATDIGDVGQQLNPKPNPKLNLKVSNNNKSSQ